MTRRPACLLPVVLLVACGSRPEPVAERAASPPGNTRASAREIRVTPELQKKWGLATGPVAHLAVSGGLTLPGVVTLSQQRTAQISALLEGTITSIGADLGDEVRRDQVLVALHSPALAQAQTSFLQANARRTLARRELERATELLKDEAIQRKELQRRQAELDAATTEYGLAESQLHSFGWDHAQLDALLQRATRGAGDLSDLVDPSLRLRAPIDGRIITRDAVIGEHVQPGKLIFTVSDLSTLWAVLDAREKDLPGLVAGTGVAITTEVYPDRRFDGRLARIGDFVDEKLRTVKLRVEVPNPGLLLKPNMFVQGAIAATGRRHDVLGVPEEAIQTIDGEPTVFVAVGDGGFAAKPVVVGERVGPNRAVTRGLDGHEIIVISGAFNLKAELLKSSFAGE